MDKTTRRPLSRARIGFLLVVAVGFGLIAALTGDPIWAHVAGFSLLAISMAGPLHPQWSWLLFMLGAAVVNLSFLAQLSRLSGLELTDFATPIVLLGSANLVLVLAAVRLRRAIRRRTSADDR